ncbi:IclR family transcriptional regulator [Burkholderia sp. Ac-20379]|uniref:IclR family transcriptional regulator n=1 Tax=Burkholderia sp. Ac-20379 TaxID=2703900 RepID=UPI0019823FB2|nr:IclR family transcriptional regulator [Burkholderia sp. Ac-20379]MBN3724160.1 IclR family transcriptional regulator [Burkholderia sp. Ac-20379]
MNANTKDGGSSTDAEEGGNLLFNQSLEKGLSVLSAFNTERPTMTIAEIATASGINKSSAQRMVYTLEQLGYLRKHPVTRRYQLTLKVMKIGYNYLTADPLIDLSNPFLSELTNVTSETTCLTEPDGDEMVYLARFVSAQFVPLHMPIGSRIPMYCSASGRAYLSALHEGEARALIEQAQRVQLTPRTKTSIEEIMDELRLTRQRGYALNGEEMFLGDMTVASPIIGSKGRPLGAVHIVAPTSRWTLAEAEAKLAPPLLQSARAICNSARALG